MLEVAGLSVWYGDVNAITDIDLCVNRGEIVGLLGSNGAGKSTTLMAISGVRSRCQGSVKLLGKEILGKPANEIARAGISQVPEGRRIFSTLSVEDNLRVGAQLSPRNARVNLDRVYSLFPILKERRKLAGSTLSGGEQQMLALGRSLMSDPKLVLMDEPSLGLAPLVVELIYEVIRELSADGLTFLIVEQNTSMLLTHAARAYVLALGTCVWSGVSNDLLENPEVQAAYFGKALVATGDA